ncbi:MAG: amidohydrolase family protein [Candidatus Omnitrophota bacterium]|nr:amidohydrolase family protein [Candidatus Omnitrophota bacterium]
MIDVHSHYMPPDVAQNTMFFKVNWSDLDRQLETMDQCGIEKSVLLYPTSDAHLNMGGWPNLCRIYNEAIASAVRKHPDRLIGGGILPPDDPASLKNELNRLADLGFRVLSLASSYNGKYLDDEYFFPVYEFAASRSLPVHVHPQILNPIGEERLKDPLLSPVLEYVFDVSVCIGKLMMSGVFARFPDVKFIFAHYGGVLPIVKERFDNTYQMLRRRNFVRDLGRLPGEYFRNLYFDTSGSKSAASLLCALEVTDPSHILYGSDFPANQDMPASIAVIRQSAAGESSKEQILSANTKKLLGLR